MGIKKLLEDIKYEIKESSMKTNNNMEDLKTKIDMLENKLNTQNSRLSNFFNKIDDLKQVNLENATLLEEIAYCLLEDNPTMDISPENQEKISNNNLEKEKYVN